MTRPVLRRSGFGALVVVLSVVLAACGSSSDSKTSTSAPVAQKSTIVPDITKPYDPSIPAGTKSGAPERYSLVAFGTDQFWLDWSKAMDQGAKASNLDYTFANAKGDAAKYIDLAQQASTRGVGGTVLIPIDPKATDNVTKKVIEAGGDVMALQAPGTTQVGSDEAANGKLVGAAAAKYINDKMGGKAEILLLNEDQSPPIKPRYDAIRATLKADAPNAKIVKDLTPENSADDGFKQTNASLAANPDINVVIGPGLATLGAFAAMNAKHKTGPNVYIASVGGTQEEIAAIKKPDSTYRASWAQPWQLIGYMSPVWTRQWLDGKTVPMGVYAPFVEITADNYQQYESDMADPSKVVSENRIDKYMTLWGSINYDTRNDYYKQSWAGPST